MTSVADAVTSIRERLNESSASQWTDVQIRRWLNEGIRDMARRTFHYQDSDTIAVTGGANNGIYTCATDVLRINQVYWTPDSDTSQKVPLQAHQWATMDQYWGNRQDQQSGWPFLWATRGYCPTLSIKIFPVPSEDGDLYLNVARLPAAINVASGGGDVDAPEAWIEVAYFYCEYMARRKDRDMEWAMDSKNQYDSLINSMIVNGDYTNAPDEFIWNGRNYLPDWLVNPGYG